MDFRECYEHLNEGSPARNREEEFDGRIYIYNPTVDRIKRGMMIRVNAPGESGGCTGEVVLEVDAPNDQVLVQGNTGGTEEWKRWYPVDQVQVVWDIGGYGKFISAIDQFGAEVKGALKKRGRGGIEDALDQLRDEIDKDVK